MSKFQAVRKALFEDSGIVVVDIQIKNVIPKRDGPWSELIDVYVAPKKSIYEAERLQKIMLRLVPDILPVIRDNFRGLVDSLEFGKLCFDENIGTENIHREITLSDEDLHSKSFEGFKDGRRVTDETLDLQRRTWVRLYPNARIATLASQGECKYSIKLADMKIGERFSRTIYRSGRRS